MLRKGPTEKEKILKHLTEKEIKDQLYGFRVKEPQAVKEESAVVKPVVKKEIQKEAQQKEVKKETQKKSQEQKNPYLVIQIVLLAVFLMLIWVSLRQMIKAISKMHNRPVVTSEQIYKKPVKKINKK